MDNQKGAIITLVLVFGSIFLILLSGLLGFILLQRESYFDEKLARDPPPLLPYVSQELELISWEEIQ